MERMVLVWAQDVPIVTRCWFGGIVLTSVLVSAGVIKLTDLVFVPHLVTKKHEFWRLVLPFLYFGEPSITLVYYLYNVSQHSRALEEAFSSAWEYLWFLLLNGTLLVLYGMYFHPQMLMGQSLLDALMYIWGRKNPDQQLTLLGLITFRASYYALFVLGSAFIIHGEISPWEDLSGIAVGHLVFYFEEVFSKNHNFNPLQPPWLWFQRRPPVEQVAADAVVVQEQEPQLEQDDHRD